MNKTPQEKNRNSNRTNDKMKRKEKERKEKERPTNSNCKRAFNECSLAYPNHVKRLFLCYFSTVFQSNA